MSESARGCRVAIVALLLPVVATAQDRSALQQRLNQLEDLRRTAVAALAQAESLRRETFDTITAGSLVVVSRPNDVGLIRRAARLAWSRLDSLYGDEAVELAARPMLFFIQGNPISDDRRNIAKLQRVMVARGATESDVAFQLVRAGSAAIRASVDTVLANWLGPQLLPDVPLPLMHSRVYVELVTAPSIAVRRCYAGALDGCGAALDLAQGDRALLWYDAAERRAVVRQHQDIPQMGLRASINSCLLSELDDACLDVLRAIQIPAPLSNDARQALVRLALSAGGRSAFRRLSQSSGQPLARRLAIAGAVPLDSLVHQWRDQVIAARPRPVTLTAAIGWTALGWSLVFGLIALRSTRWR
jgi:hypothetical protein